MPERAGDAEAALDETRADVVRAREEGDAETEEALTAEWYGRLRCLLAADPSIAQELERALNEARGRLPAGEHSFVGSVRLTAHATGNGRVYQAGRDQHITEYHTHYHTDLRSVVEEGRPGPDSVRVPLAARPLSAIRDRVAVRRALAVSVSDGVRSSGVHVVHRMPGCGKTAIAQVLFDEAVRDHGLVGLWVTASHTTSFREGMLAVALDRGASQDEVDAARALRRPPADLVWHYLDRSAERWLLVLDTTPTIPPSWTTAGCGRVWAALS
ncbi:hypothetical protein [Streptomyces regalis]|uniref:hypothetical protein n=1 Tax=Streptomyces regalis TaxID=68262 RepID=UPI0007C72895|nr:hypothetical protein [Streptomyces regalis]